MFDCDERTITLKQVMALCVEVEKQDALKTNTTIPAAIVNIVFTRACHYYGEIGQKFCVLYERVR